MIPAEFEEKSYEAPLYNQLERGDVDVFTPGQVLENVLGFDRGVFFTQLAMWQTLGYKNPLRGAALAYYDWPYTYGPPRPREQLPRFRLNLFLQAKRPVYYQRKPRSLKSIAAMRAPLWGFRVTNHQQSLLEVLAQRTKGKAHVSYAAAAFHTNAALFSHTKQRTIVQNSTFPSAVALAGHEAWYYQAPGTTGAANPNPELIEEPSLRERMRIRSRESVTYDAGDLRWLDVLAGDVIESARTAEGPGHATSAYFFDDLQTLDRLADGFDLSSSLRAYAQISLFTIRFDLNWLVVADASKIGA